MSFKKAVYLLASTILGALLSFIIRVFVEINYLNWAQKNNYHITFYGHYALHPALQAAFWISGIIGGFFLGKFWWRKVYVEKVWRKNK